MEYLVASDKTVLTIEASSYEAAFKKAEEILLPTAYDKKYGNMRAVPKPSTEEGWKTLATNICISNGEHLEFFEYIPAESRRMEAFVDAEIARLYPKQDTQEVTG